MCHVAWRADPQLSAVRWHIVGLISYLVCLALYAAAGWYVGGTSVNPRLYTIVGVLTLVAAVGALFGWCRGWQKRRVSLIVWPVASLVATILVGSLDPDATRSLPGIITITFAYVGLACSRWRSLALVPLGVVALVVGGTKALPSDIPAVVLTAIMWVIVAEVPASLIARLEEQSALLREIAQTDALTQLFDRSTLGPRLAAHARDSSVVLIDLDNFKGHNDRHGHGAGDALLVDFADALRWSVRQDDMVFRIGGDEFLLLLIGADRAEAQRVIERLRQRWAHAGAPVTFSTGTASGEQDLIRIADERMYASKRSRGLPSD